MNQKLKPFASFWMEAFNEDTVLLPVRPAEIIRAKEDIAAYVYARRATNTSVAGLLFVILVTLLISVGLFVAEGGTLVATKLAIVLFTCVSVYLGYVTLTHVVKILKNKPDQTRRVQIEEYFSESLLLVALSEFGRDALNEKMWTPDEFMAHLHKSLSEHMGGGGKIAPCGNAITEVLILIALRVLVGEMLSRFFPDEHKRGRSQEWKNLLGLINSIACKYGYRVPRLDDVFAAAQKRLDSADDV